MSRGLGRVQRRCLDAIRKYETQGKCPTTFNITAEVYEVQRDEDGNRYVSDAQHVAVKRALRGLRRQGRVIGFHTDRARCPELGDGRVERCLLWAMASAA